MKKEDLDRALSESTEIRVSDGFAESVMERVRLEAKAPPPLVFPWKRFSAGMGTCAVLTIVAVVLAIDAGVSGGSSSEWFEEAMTGPYALAWQWTLGSLLASLAMYRGTMRLAGYRR